MRLITIFILLFTVSSVMAQSSPLRSININRIEVNEDGLLGNGSLSNDVISKLSLTQRHYKKFYSYWTFQSISITTLDNIDGSVSSSMKSIPLNLSISNKGQEVEFSLSNNSIYWIGVDVSSFNYYISYFINDNRIDYTSSEFDKTLGTLFNYERGIYDYVLVPPRATTKWSMFRIDGMQKGYDIIHSCIKNNSRLDMCIPICIYNSDPFTSEKNKMRSKTAYQYSQYTPVQARLDYKGGYYKEGEVIHISNDYIDLVKPSYSYEMFPATLKIVCDIKVSTNNIPTKKNRYGLYIYSK